MCDANWSDFLRFWRTGSAVGSKEINTAFISAWSLLHSWFSNLFFWNFTIVEVPWCWHWCKIWFWTELELQLHCRWTNVLNSCLYPWIPCSIILILSKFCSLCSFPVLSLSVNTSRIFCHGLLHAKPSLTRIREAFGIQGVSFYSNLTTKDPFSLLDNALKLSLPIGPFQAPWTD